MAQTYKIHYNDSYILLTRNMETEQTPFAKVLSQHAEIKDLFKKPDFLFDGKTKQNILILTELPEKAMEWLMDETRLVIAAGGIVENEREELLLIHRRGKWDLPKGKVERGEELTHAAIREVEEETGVRIQKLLNRKEVTYHCYQMKGQNCLKQTHWYGMLAQPNQDNLVPQTEEDIDLAKWMQKQEIPSLREGMYPMIWDILAE